MTQPAAESLNQFPNLIELIGRQGGLQGSETWWGPTIGGDEVSDGGAPAIGSDELSDGAPAIGSDELSDGAGVESSSADDENFLQDEIQNGPLNAVSFSGTEAIGQDEIGSTRAPRLDAKSLCSGEAIGQDEVTSPPAPKLDTMSICSDEAIGQDEIPPGAALQLDTMSICSDENFLQDEVAVSDSRLKTDIAQVGTTAHDLPLYNFRYIGGTEVYEGVMAQDVLKVMPSAVLRGADGYYRVKYKDLGVQMRRVA